MWNHISSSKVLQRKLDKQNYTIHREHLSKIKAVMKISRPIINHKKFTPCIPLQQKKTDSILKDKIITAKPDPKHSHVEQWRPWRPFHPPQNFQDKNLRQIVDLINVTTHYPVEQIKKEMKQLKKIRINISINARRAQQHLQPKQLRKRYFSFRKTLPHWNPDTKVVVRLARPKSAFARRFPIDQLEEHQKIQHTMAGFESIR